MTREVQRSAPRQGNGPSQSCELTDDPIAKRARAVDLTERLWVKHHDCAAVLERWADLLIDGVECHLPKLEGLSPSAWAVLAHRVMDETERRETSDP